ncbi:MAG: hypothetical protein OET79_06700 [Nitrospirota bacterium]|nr:hypothetical protein [Nitrospirota bacterium]
MEVFHKSLSSFKSSLYEVARSLLRSRTRLYEKTKQLQASNNELRLKHQELLCQIRQAQEREEQQRQLCQRYQKENRELLQKPIRLPAELPLPNHSYGPGLIALCLNLAKQIGFRAASSALRIVFDHFGIENNVPHHDSIRTWMCRVGIAEMKKSFNDEDDIIWFSDHSSQIGAEKVLTILGTNVKNLPPKGRALKLTDVRVLTVVPGRKWKKDDVGSVYRETAKQNGVPRDLVCDGATELRDPVQKLEKVGKTPNVIGDMKHRAANILEKVLGKDERFVEFQKQVGLTRNRVQQTELSHFAPPPIKQKSRFMNLGPLLRWGTMVCGHLSHPNSKGRKGITDDRMNEKLGWVGAYQKDLASWNRCQELINLTLKFINTNGLYQGASKRLTSLLEETASNWTERCKASDTVMKGLIEHAVQSESCFGEGERGWGSTEVLESLYGQYKRLEGQHSKGGFTSLLAALPALTVDWTAARVRENMTRVSVQQMKDWVKDNLGQTLASRRMEAYRELASGFG